VVEHDEEAINSADHVLDMGPGAGEHGGRVVAEGTPEQIRRNPASLTGQYLSGALEIALPETRRRFDKTRVFRLRGAAREQSQELSISPSRWACSCA